MGVPHEDRFPLNAPLSAKNQLLSSSWQRLVLLDKYVLCRKLGRWTVWTAGNKQRLYRCTPENRRCPADTESTLERVWSRRNSRKPVLEKYCIEPLTFLRFSLVWQFDWREDKILLRKEQTFQHKDIANTHRRSSWKMPQTRTMRHILQKTQRWFAKET